MSEELAERIIIAAPIEAVYHAVSDVRRATKWSPECVGVWVWLRRRGRTSRFVGFNRLGAVRWFTTCRVVRDEARVEFAYEVAAFGMLVSQWGYRVAESADVVSPDGVRTATTEVTEYWIDRRSALMLRLGRKVMGPAADRREEMNRDGMRTTLRRLKQDIEEQPAIR